MRFFVRVMVIVASIALCVPAVAADTPQAKRLLQSYRTAKSTEVRDTAFDKLILLDAKTIGQLSSTIDTAIKKELAAYLRSFGKQANRLAAKRAKSIPVAEVKALRAEVLALGELGDQLTTDLLEQKAVPALARTRELLMIDSEEILASDAKLKSQRKRLLTLGDQQSKCEAALSKLAPDSPRATVISFEKLLAEEEAASTIDSLAISPASKATFAANAKRAIRLDPQSVAAMRQCNLTRVLLGLNVLAIDPRLIKAAEMHSADMEKHNFFDHISPVAGRESPLDRARLADTTVTAENIYMADKPMLGSDVSDAWFTSPPHHLNMLRPHLRIGVGRHGGYFTQMFGS